MTDYSTIDFIPLLGIEDEINDKIKYVRVILA